MLIEVDLNQNDMDALLHHCRSYVPQSDDIREDRRLAHALEELAQAIENSERQIPIKR